MQNAHQRGQQGAADPWIGGASQGLPTIGVSLIVLCQTAITDLQFNINQVGCTARRLPVKGPLSLPVTTWD